MRRVLSRFPTSTLMGLAFVVTAMGIAGGLLYYHSMEARQFLADEGVRYGDMLADQLLSASQRFLRLGSRSAVQEVIEETGSKRSVIYNGSMVMLMVIRLYVRKFTGLRQ